MRTYSNIIPFFIMKITLMCRHFTRLQKKNDGQSQSQSQYLPGSCPKFDHYSLITPLPHRTITDNYRVEFYLY